MLASGTHLALYLQLYNQVKDDIRHGIYKRGEQLPTEYELAKENFVSRVTVRKALDQLEKEGLIARHQGRGTFVSDHSLKRDVSRNTSFSEICSASGKKPGARTIKLLVENATPGDAEAFHLNLPSKVIVLKRIRYADGQPVAIESSRFPESFSFLINEDLNDASLISVLSEKYNIRFTRSTQKTIKLVYANYGEAKYLSIPKGYPLISITCLSFDDTGRPCHRSKQLVVGDKFELTL